MVLEEGLDIALLRRVVASMKRVADASGVAIVTGDTKVVERGAADKLFINTAGIGSGALRRHDLGRRWRGLATSPSSSTACSATTEPPS